MNCFTPVPDCPTIGSGLGSDSDWVDMIHAMDRNGVWPSYCQQTQLFQWCSGWPSPPAETADAPWTTLVTHHCHNKIWEAEDTHLWLEVAKDDYKSWKIVKW